MRLTVAASVGDAAIHVNEHQCGMQVGTRLTIGGSEVVRVAGFGSILLAAPLQHSYAAGTRLEVRDKPPPMPPPSTLPPASPRPRGPPAGPSSTPTQELAPLEVFSSAQTAGGSAAAITSEAPVGTIALIIALILLVVGVGGVCYFNSTTGAQDKSPARPASKHATAIATMSSSMGLDRAESLDVIGQSIERSTIAKAKAYSPEAAEYDIDVEVLSRSNTQLGRAAMPSPTRPTGAGDEYDVDVSVEALSRNPSFVPQHAAGTVYAAQFEALAKLESEDSPMESPSPPQPSTQTRHGPQRSVGEEFERQLSWEVVRPRVMAHVQTPSSEVGAGAATAAGPEDQPEQRLRQSRISAAAEDVASAVSSVVLGAPALGGLSNTDPSQPPPRGPVLDEVLLEPPEVESDDLRPPAWTTTNDLLLGPAQWYRRAEPPVGADYHAPDDIPMDIPMDEERRRMLWIKYYVDAGELQEAFDLGWDGEALHSVSAAGGGTMHSV